MVLAIGSPTLAIYSLTLTVLNSHWVFRRVTEINYPNRWSAAVVLTRVQQITLKVTSKDGLLASLIVLVENDKWWEEMSNKLESTSTLTWSIVTATSIAWVVIAFTFTLVDSFPQLIEQFGTSSEGQSIGLFWLWLLPLVVGWSILPVYSRLELVSALLHVNEIAYVATEEISTVAVQPAYTPVLASEISHQRAISILYREEAVYRDQGRSAPIFNYARVFGWVNMVDEVLDAFECASDNFTLRLPVSKVHCDLSNMENSLRAGSGTHVTEYCGNYSSRVEEKRRRWGDSTVTRICVGSIFGLAIQWSTTLSAVLGVYSTPTRGIGCRSGAYIIYGALSTLIWEMLLVSSILAHYCSLQSPHENSLAFDRTPRFNSKTTAAWMSVFLRRLAITLASVNSIWIMTICMFQFTQIFSTCYCDSGVIGRGVSRAFNTVIVSQEDVAIMGRAWVGSLVLSGGVVSSFLLFVAVMIKRPNK